MSNSVTIYLFVFINELLVLQQVIIIERKVNHKQRNQVF